MKFGSSRSLGSSLMQRSGARDCLTDPTQVSVYPKRAALAILDCRGNEDDPYSTLIEKAAVGTSARSSVSKVRTDPDDSPMPRENWSQGPVPDGVNGRRAYAWRPSGALRVGVG